MNEQEAASAQLDLIDLIDMIWKGRWFVVSVMLVSLLVGAVVYFFAPARYRSEVEVTPLTGAKFAQYADFTALDRFGYTRNTLAIEYSKYLTDRDRLALAAGKVNAADVTANFKIKDADPAGPGQERAFVSLQMTSTYNDEDKLNGFVADALKRASRDLAVGIRSEIERRLAAHQEENVLKIRKAEVQIAAEREKLAAERHDGIEKLKKEALVARSFGLARPLELQAQTLTIDRYAPVAANRQATQERQAAYPKYFDGYLALEEQINQLESRKNDDPFIPDLRDLQKTIFLLKNDAEQEQLKELLDRSILNRPDQAEFASYSLIEARAEKIFPKALIIIAVALIVGFLAGVIGAIVKGARASKRRFEDTLRSDNARTA